MGSPFVIEKARQLLSGETDRQTDDNLREVGLCLMGRDVRANGETAHAGKRVVQANALVIGLVFVLRQLTKMVIEVPSE